MTSLPTQNAKDDFKPNELYNYQPNIINQTIFIKQTIINQIRHIDNDDYINWTKVTSNLFVMGAYLDMRKNNEFYIRFLTIMKKASENYIKISCAFNNNKTYQSVKYEFNENHGMEFGGYIHSCAVPNNVINFQHINLVEHRSGQWILLKLKLLSLENNGKFINKFSLCIPPLYGNINRKNLIAFIEMNLIFGADHFYFYDYRIDNEDIKTIFQYYHKKRIVTIQKWTIPTNNIWYNGQMSNIHHCLYENIGSSKYTIFQDIDELFVPIQNNNWHELMTNIDDGKHCGYKISSTFFTPSNDPLKYFSSIIRTKNINKFRSKCIVRPELIFEQGIHHISKQNIEYLTPITANNNQVLIFHYKNCDMLFNFDCSQKIVDEKLKIYSKVFHKNYQSMLKLFKL